MKNLVCIAGPTASGKTALSIALAKELDGEIVSCDSMQVYKRMDIGTAKPTAEERENIPHYMLSVAEPWEDFSVSKYCDMAAPIVDDILARGKTAIIVGGTGLYMDALIKGNAFAPCPSTGCRERLEKLAEEEGIEAVIGQLRAVDPESADRLHSSDRKRIIRAMEVYLETGETITQHNLKTQQLPPRYNPVWFALEDADRATLYERIDRRVEEMLRLGLLDEIKALLAEGVPEKATAMQAIGYKEFVDALAGRSSIETATALVQQASRKYAKRQLTWFRRNPAIHWLRREPGERTGQILSKATQILAESDK
ncbi:MAG: tRNA (adenosine(37)-N6)-dimethylallyltransferase MiaA [Oscillospiraceae bacterium]|nr:tRNA (adenosine(37)-N6)-dimethylallyltransferase MiaA [Oscillospiraceae bacterium]